MEENINNLIPSYISDITKIGYNPNLLASPFSVSEPNINDMSNSNFNPNIKGSSYVRGLAGKRNGSQYKTNTSLIASSDEQYYVLSGKREGDNIVLEKDIYEVHIRGRRSANSLSPIIANSNITGKREGGADLIFDANGNIIDSRRPIGGGNIDLDNNDLIKGKRGLGNQLIDTSNDSGDLGEISNRNGNNLNNGLIDNNPGDSSGDGSNNGNGNNNNNGLDNNSGNENNSGTGSGDDSGNGSGDGTGNGSGDGSGNGSGDGSGNGSGNGTGNSNGSNNSNLNYNDGRFGDGSNNGSNRNDRGSSSGDRGEESSNSQNNDSFLDRLGNDALQYLLNGLLSSLFGRGNGELQDRYITVPYLQQELCGECFGLLNLSEANFGGAFLNGTPVTAFPEDSTELSNMAAGALLDAADAAVATTLNGINAVKQIANGNFEELGQELITATVKKITEVSGQFVGTALNIVTTSVINIPAKITDASMTYFYTYKSTLGEMIKEVTTSLESQAEENVTKEDKEREAKKVKDMQDKIDNFNKGVIFFSNMATEYAGMVNSYLHMGPEWVADKLDGVCVTILGQIHKYTMGQVQTITDAIDDFCEKQGEKAGKILVEVYNAALRFIAIQTVQLSKKIIALSLSTAVAILQEVILKLMALLGVPLPVPPLASLLPQTE